MRELFSLQIYLYIGGIPYTRFCSRKHRVPFCILSHLLSLFYSFYVFLESVLVYKVLSPTAFDILCLAGFLFFLSENWFLKYKNCLFCFSFGVFDIHRP